ncbi:MAG TPA: hypothetical protein VFG21_11645, partial [Xanthomonadaceae bacterium]|nr:hypothetical protein [Xanthomonadaceae bacterium]
HASALYFLHPGLLGVQRLGPDGVRKTLLDGFELVVPEAISIGGGHLFIIGSAPEDGTRRLFSYDLATGSVRALVPLVAYTRHAHTAAAPDGSAVYYSQTEDIESDLVAIDAPG